MNYTSEYLIELKGELEDSSGVSSDLLEHLLTLDCNYAVECFRSEGINNSLATQFIKLWMLTNGEHYCVSNCAKPKYSREALGCWDNPKTIETCRNTARLLVLHTGTIQMRLTNRYFTGYDFLFVWGRLKARVILVPELYPWLLVEVGSKLAKSFDSLYFDNKHWVILKQNNINKCIRSSSNRLHFVAQNYEMICALLECEKLTPLVGNPFDLKMPKKYPGTHKSPVEHARCEHIRHYKSGKETLVRATTVCAGR